MENSHSQPPKGQMKHPAKDIIEKTAPIEHGSDRRRIEDTCRCLHLRNEEIHIIEQRFRMSLENGLSRERNPYSSIRCLPTFVRHLPTGREKGKFLALDLGGTNFRVLSVEMFGELDREPIIQARKFPVPQSIMQGKGDALFDYIATCIGDFVKEEKLQKDGETLKIGFTFSFPCNQTGLKSGTLVKWSKGFNCEDVVGKDVCQLLKEAMDRRGDLKVEITALLNDSTACLLSCAWKEPRCRIGLILGTGCNACYLEDLDKVELYDGPRDGPKTMVINTECGAFGEFEELEFVRTKWDKLVDENSLNPGQQIYEKMVSGMYMGEIIRYILVDLADKNLIFKGTRGLDELRKSKAFQSRHLCEVESDPIGEFSNCKTALNEALGTTHQEFSDEDCYSVRFVCEEVSRRASMLLAAGIAGLMKKMNYKDVVVAVDGTLFRKHPLFPSIMKKKVTQLMGYRFKFDLKLAEDGSGLGAAVIAAVEEPAERSSKDSDEENVPTNE